MKYTHLYNRIADTYFTRREEVSRGNINSKNRPNLFIGIGIVSLIVLIGVLLFSGNIFKKANTVKAQKKSLSVLANILPLKLNYNFSQTHEKIKSISLDLPKINLVDYDVLEFALRGDPQEGFSSLIKVGLESSRREKKSIYIRGIESRWKTFKIPLEISELKSFSDLSGISFIVEGWNIEKEQGRIFIDKIKFTKKE
ncbi:MAG: hypothetical protein KJ593_05245 [Candidatus Omnitrophica bacterium]|nr:hypothetical protein [Candidatus Omnitrophota bacterium]